MKNIAVLGSTGSIGTQTLEIVRANDDLNVVSLAAGSNIEMLEKQIREFKPQVVCVYNEKKAEELKIKVSDTDVKIVTGMDGLIETAVIKTADIVLTAVVGMIGIRPTIAAIKAGKDIALANKETLVTAGHIIIPLAKEYGIRILPVDSEHSAIFQSLQGNKKSQLSKILLTASGGPFRNTPKEDLKNVTVKDALKHPNWSMGRKITIDSATMVNKGLEVIEAKWLFDVDIDNIEVVVQPQSLIHSMVEYVDGGIMAQLGTPDMKLPIQYALFYPDRRTLDGKRVNFFDIANITFFKPDRDKFKGFDLAFKAGKTGGSLPTIYNAANELAVSKFLNEEIRFLDIPELIETAMNNHKVIDNPSLEQILESEKEAYESVNIALSKR
ncbi:MAG: 1-deoxy-D-xylulose-5-phosphate reductoisomerase [Clostridiales bacterium]|jgi:1-deoxy-D-xylulose-5-phosphate reductoisomerase|uniref:1-deoxy-D-xylulose-5-phosphate reductoisomerase n=1 Tax=Bovifimicola ammoniilytica TaxID=2981720 RepID=UPI0008210BA4|nr:1-deoxy-D-xylulose-5-phosphate reductoisomerase [Bovifimicola ammoniilytica]MBD8941896.1 1-deoxy-D-xylulose-5-phosphate reductoisomerase [Clostridiales bacterium]MCU6753256.1 1-deoxy-D-xylulose-5-phosphate reductoisomerase [Bovifimicola ammoniilytica]SCJ58097.1 1-deoxy-D-xylulose 5-phosphate reductoisomerase [uncultured Eubacterium sp.]